MHFKVFKRKIKDTMFGSTTDTAASFQLKDMEDARYGAMYFLANVEIKKNFSLSKDWFGGNVISTEPLDDIKTVSTILLNKTKVGRKITGAVNVLGDAISTVIDKIKGMIQAFFECIIGKVRSVYGVMLYGAEWITEMGVWLAQTFSKSLADVIPGLGYASSALDIYSGIRQAVLKSIDFGTQLYAGRGVELLGGHPSIIANALARHSAVGIAGGVKSIAYGATSIGLEAAADSVGGAGMIVSVVTGILDRITELVDRLVQISVMKYVSNKAKKEWENRGSATSMLNNHKAFSEWFQNTTITTPVVAALVMGSGFVAHSNKFLQLLDENAEIKTQNQFDKGITYIEKLKSLSGKYVREYIDGYGVDFTSLDGVVNARLTELTNGKALLDGTEFTVQPISPSVSAIGAMATGAPHQNSVQA
ncbi:hypothetical protein D5018_02980 [Parashewanella curva]|uniref:Uncharacterized protein n=1 Tax=Parashewanella curva TaxID=2338552 RepID=A0A3L8Q0S3_9GAMM|nr:hypothetical protein [Parashewanella curva]RLV61236.1 hypothetical protein D5018_02980 [Parashewanella curva]